MRVWALLLAAACGHTVPHAAAVSGPARSDLSRVAGRVAPETVVNDRVLADRGTELRAGLRKALAHQGFALSGGPGPLTVTSSIRRTPSTAARPASVYMAA